MPKERYEQEGVVSLADQAHVRWDNDGSVINLRQINDVDEQAKRRCVIKHQAAAAVDLIFSRTNPVIWATGDISDMFAGVMNGLDELRRDMTKRIDQVDERAHKGQENLRDELTHVKSQARFDQAQLIRNTDQCLAESLAQANKESYEREARMTRETERLLNDHDSTYAHTMTSLEKRLDAKYDLMMRKLDAILNGINWLERSNPRERSRHANDADGTDSNTRAQQGSRTNYEPRNKERPRSAPSRPGWTNPVPPEADATPETRLPTVPQVSSVPDLTTVSQNTTMYASMFEPLNRSLETFITKLSKSTERGERSRRTLKKPKSYKDETDGCIDTWIEVMKLHFEEENLSKKQECSANEQPGGYCTKLCNGEKSQ